MPASLGPALPRRRFGLGLAGLVGLAGSAGLAGLAATALRAETAIELDWAQLIPPGSAGLPPSLQGIVPHDRGASAGGQPASAGVRSDWNGMTVRISGFMIPLDHDGTGVRSFVLVPYVGACIHVPPPPANQLVLVTSPRPYQSDQLFEAVTVTGMFGTASTTTQLAEIGYALSADRIEPYRR